MMTLSTFRSSTSIGKRNIADMRIAKEFSTSGGFVVPLWSGTLASYSSRVRYMNSCPCMYQLNCETVGNRYEAHRLLSPRRCRFGFPDQGFNQTGRFYSQESTDRAGPQFL